MTRRTSPDSEPMSARHFLDVAAAARRMFDVAGVSIGDSPLEKDILLLERLGTADIGPEEVDGLADSDARTVLHAYMSLPRTRKIVAALSVGVGIAGFDAVAKHLRNLRWMTGAGAATQAWDQLFELEVAAQLRVGGPSAVRFGEPDIRLLLDNHQWIAVACKRVTGERACREKVGRAVAQIAKSGVPGFIVVNIDQLLAPSLEVAEPSETKRRVRKALKSLADLVREDATAWPTPEVPDRVEGVPAAAVLTVAPHVVSPPGADGQCRHQVLWESRIVKNPGLSGRVRRGLHGAAGRIAASLEKGHAILTRVDLARAATLSDNVLRDGHAPAPRGRGARRPSTSPHE